MTVPAPAPATRRAALTYWTQDSPLGRLTLIASNDGLCRVLFADQEPEAALAAVSAAYRRSAAPVEHADARTAAQLDEYFAGTRTAFNVPLDLSLATPKRRPYLRVLLGIPCGQTLSYKDVATRAGKPKGSQAAGQAVGHNPLPILVPCHRVIAADGSLGGYSGGLDRKRALLALEGHGDLFGGWQAGHRRQRGFRD